MNGRVTCVGVPARRRGTRVICYFRRPGPCICDLDGNELTSTTFNNNASGYYRTATLCVIAYNVGAFFGMFRVLRRLPHPRFESYCALFKTV